MTRIQSRMTGPKWAEDKMAAGTFDRQGFAKSVKGMDIEDVRYCRQTVRAELSRRRTERSVEDMDVEQAKALIAQLQGKLAVAEKIEKKA